MCVRVREFCEPWSLSNFEGGRELKAKVMVALGLGSGGVYGPEGGIIISIIFIIIIVITTIIIDTAKYRLEGNG